VKPLTLNSHTQIVLQIGLRNGSIKWEWPKLILPYSVFKDYDKFEELTLILKSILSNFYSHME